MRKWLVPLLVCLGGLNAGAWAKDVYVCEQNGVKTFSELPCGAKSEVVQGLGERSVAFSVNMPSADIRYFCKIALRGWDKSAAEATNARNYRYSYRGRSTRDNVRGYILSHVSNLEDLARDEPQLYSLVKDLASTYSVNYADRSEDYDASRENAKTECQERIESSLSSVASRMDQVEKDKIRRLNSSRR